MPLDTVQIFHPYAMLALKGWQMLFDLALIPMLYLLLRRHGELCIEFKKFVDSI